VITRAAEGIIGGRSKVVDVKTTVARIAGILVAVFGPGPATHAAMVAAR
jgi:phage shock protein PspC (stress-responsive transcriptional regulator)